jgi:hypothetical protein
VAGTNEHGNFEFHKIEELPDSLATLASNKRLCSVETIRPILRQHEPKLNSVNSLAPPTVADFFKIHLII